jgi:membrane-bound ClpP family serine protease
MDPLFLILLLVVAGLIMLVGDLFLPSAGIMSILGIGLLLTAVIICFTINRWLGLAVLFTGVIASPFIAMALVRAWQLTPVGRRMILDHAEAAPMRDAVRVGKIGRCLSALRPMGECAFPTPLGEIVLECRSEFADLPAGTIVRVSHLKDGIATVRPADAPGTTQSTPTST